MKGTQQGREAALDGIKGKEGRTYETSRDDERGVYLQTCFASAKRKMKRDLATLVSPYRHFMTQNSRSAQDLRG